MMESSRIVCVSPAELREQTEEQLIEKARQAHSQTAWVIGACSAEWCQKYARGRTDHDFGHLIGMDGDQVQQRRAVWSRFNGERTSDTYRKLAWSHFYAALRWDDAEDCLTWASENEATVAQMKAWREARHTPSQEGEDDYEDGDDDEDDDDDDWDDDDDDYETAVDDMPWDNSDAVVPVAPSHSTDDSLALQGTDAAPVAGQQNESRPPAQTTPADLVPVFAACREFRVLVRSVNTVKVACSELMKQKSAVWMDLPGISRLCDDLKAFIKHAMPYSECAKCRRDVKLRATCRCCRGCGFVTKPVASKSFSQADLDWLKTVSVDPEKEYAKP